MRVAALVACTLQTTANSYRIVDFGDATTGAQRPTFSVYDSSNVGHENDPVIAGRPTHDAIGIAGTQTQPHIYRGVFGRVPCPGMVHDAASGMPYCSSTAAGRCDTRSGLCVCSPGYAGVSCNKCKPTHSRQADGCVAKVACPNNCGGAGTCNVTSGACVCRRGHTGADCSVLVCRNLDPFCKACTDEAASQCAECEDGFYLNLGRNIFNSTGALCIPCTVHDPACSACDAQRCLSCADPLLHSAARSGNRAQDAAGTWLQPQYGLTPAPAGSACRLVPPHPDAPDSGAIASDALQLLPFGAQDPPQFSAARPYELMPTNSTAQLATPIQPQYRRRLSHQDRERDALTGRSRGDIDPFLQEGRHAYGHRDRRRRR